MARALCHDWSAGVQHSIGDAVYVVSGATSGARHFLCSSSCLCKLSLDVQEQSVSTTVIFCPGQSLHSGCLDPLCEGGSGFSLGAIQALGRNRFQVVGADGDIRRGHCSAVGRRQKEVLNGWDG